MSERQDIVMVIANPWQHLDANGKPICAVPRDHKEDGPGYIGARFDPEKSGFVFAEGPVKCRATRYTRDRVAEKSLFPATESDAAKLRVPFVSPQVQLAEAKKIAIAEYDAQFGDGSWALANEQKSVAKSGATKATKTTVAE